MCNLHFALLGLTRMAGLSLSEAESLPLPRLSLLIHQLRSLHPRAT